MPVPMACWLLAPAPWVTVRGRTPSRKASEVMTMGLRRMEAAVIAAALKLLPCLTRDLANSTIRMAFLAERPMTASMPTWKKISLYSPLNVLKPRAPSTPMGTTRMTAMGMVHDSYMAARQRKTTRMEMAYSMEAWPPALCSSKLKPVHSRPMPCGSSSRTRRSISSMASPELTPWAGDDSIMVEGTPLKRSSWEGPNVHSRVATASSGTMPPSALRKCQ